MPPPPAAPPAAEAKTVDGYHAALTGWQHSAMSVLRGMMRRVAPGASEAIKWGQPVYEQNGPIAYVRAATDHLTFGFWRGAELPDPDGLLEGAGGKMRHVKLRSATLPTAALEAMIQRAVVLNQEKGDPTRVG